ncbi:uncharacterized protein PAC_05057 [Phialocephala subalpina]|uniref:Uncharacterized protein n=1 Tax=Phialocephala subalpina TaxID=576137 RepID=A0A1L7WQX4_9HELO|nr:uncharacterized protein PAC_05057 [Phialocephala subalpina]
MGPRVLRIEARFFWNRTKRIPTLLPTGRDPRSQVLKDGYQWVTTSENHSDGTKSPPRDPEEEDIADLGFYINYNKDIPMIANGSLFPLPTDIVMWDFVFSSIVKPAKRILTFKSFFPGEKIGAEKVFVLATTPGKYSGMGELFAELALREDFMQLMEREGTGWVRRCKSGSAEWHGKDEKCGEECRLQFEDGKPAIQALDFEKWRREQRTADDGVGSEAVEGYSGTGDAASLEA